MIAAAVVLVASVGAFAAQDQSASDLKALQGGWIVVAAEQRGKPFDAIRGGGLVIEGNSFQLRTAAGNEMKGEIKVDAAASPRHLDFLHANGAQWHAIYSVDEETFRLNYVEAGGRDTRPTLFATSSETAGTVIVMNRMVAR